MTSQLGQPTDLYEGVDSEDGKIGVALGVVDEVQIHQLFELNVTYQGASGESKEAGVRAAVAAHRSACSLRRR